MARVKMLDTTHHRDYGPMREGTVHEVSDEDAARFVRMRLAAKTSAKTTADVRAEAEEADAGGAEEPGEATLGDEATAERAQPRAMGRDDVAGLTGEAPPDPDAMPAPLTDEGETRRGRR